jgi:SsrA-binding protein
VESDKLTLIPLSLYNKGKVLKAEIALARGKKKFDKRAKIMKREANIEMERALKR